MKYIIENDFEIIQINKSEFIIYMPALEEAFVTNTSGMEIINLLYHQKTEKEISVFLNSKYISYDLQIFSDVYNFINLLVYVGFIK